MSQRRRLHIGLSLAATWLRGAPADVNPAGEHQTPLAFYVDLARRAERSKLDFVFKPDALYLMPGMAGGPLRFEGLDPTLMLAAIAHATNSIGLVTTASTTFNPPFMVARQIQSLHWLSNGRAGWNIVTSIEGSANFGIARMPSPETRYRQAAEFTDVVRRLWDSYPAGALEGGAGVGEIGHTGEFFAVKGPLNVPGHPAGRPALFQAGASDIGRTFAASIADATFAATPDMPSAIELRSDLRRRREAQVKPADSIKVLPGLYFFIADTSEAAWEMHRLTHVHMTRERRLDSVKSILGIEIAELCDQDRVTPDMLPALTEPVRSRTHADLLRRYIEQNKPSVQELLARPEVIGSAHWVSVGTPSEVVEDIVAWFEAGAIDGFIALPGGSITSLDLFYDKVVPALVERGLFRAEYTGSTLIEHLSEL